MPRWFASIGRQSRAVLHRLAVLVGCCATLLSGGMSLAQDEAAPNESSLRLRVFWDSGGQEHTWKGQVSVSQGALSEVHPWGGEADSLLLAQLHGDRVVIDAQRPQRKGGFDVSVQFSEGATLRVELKADDAEPIFAEVPLRDLAAKPYHQSLGAAGGWLQVYRATDDLLRLQTKREQLIFAPGEQFRFSLEAALPTATPHSPVDLQVELLQGRTTTLLPGGSTQRTTFPLEGSAQANFEVQLPRQEGVYALKLTAQRPSGLIRGWTKAGGKPLAERTIQVVVWDAGQATRVSESQRSVVEIDPTNSKWWQGMSEWKWMRKVPWLSTGPLGSAPAEIVTTPAGRLIRLAPALSAGVAPWQAYPLPIDDPGAPHVLEVEVPDDAPQELSLTLFDRDALGQALSLGDSLTAVSGKGRARAATEFKTVRKLFWPATDSPMLVVSNQSLGSEARYGRIRVHSLDRLIEKSPPNSPTPSSGPTPDRIVAACFTSPRLVQAMQAPLKVRQGQYVHEDWQTFYDAAVRVADYTELAGYNSAVVTVASAEGAVYPTQALGRQTGLDLELLASGVTDLPRKDLLELLLREFDRRGLKLTVLMRLESALPAIEAQRGTPEAIGIDCRDVTGQKARGGPVRYNPLAPLIQQALLDAVAEVAAKGAGHPCFAGVAIELTPASHLVLPGELGGADPRSIDRFLADSGLVWPEGVERNPETLRHALSGVWRDAWRDWRLGRMTSLYGQMAKSVSDIDPKARLMLLGGRLLEDPDGREAVRPRLEERPSLEALLAARGLSPRRLAEPPNLVFVPPRFSDHSPRLVEAAYTLQLNDLFWQERGKGTPAEAIELSSLASRVSLPTFKSRSPFGAAQTYTATTLGRTAVGVQSPRALAWAAAETPGADILEGGAAAPLALDPQAIAHRRLLRQLPPAEVLGQSPPPPQPLVVKSLVSGDHCYLLAANLSPWPLEATVTLEAPAPCVSLKLPTNEASSGSGVRTQLAAGNHALPLALPAHGLEVYRFSCPQVTVTGARTQPGPTAAASAGRGSRKPRQPRPGRQAAFPGVPQPVI